MHTSPLLSIGMIVKNEMRSLRRCLEALAPLRAALPTELVIADTGSTDGTRELAEEYADIIFDFDWRDDFAAARNAVLDKCTGLWHLQVDADEYLDGDIAQLTAFLTSPGASGRDMAFVCIRNYGSLEMLPGDYMDFYALRLLRRGSGIRYAGRVHEHLAAENPAGRAMRLTDTVFHHDGYAAEAMAGKRARNLPLLELELKDKPEDMRLLCLCLEASGSAEQRNRYAPRIAAALERPGGDAILCRWASHALITCMLPAPPPEYGEWIAKARQRFPDSILVGVGVNYCSAIYNSRMGDYPRCYEDLQGYFAALGRYDKGDYDKNELYATSLSGIARRNREGARLLETVCLRHLGRWEELAAGLKGLNTAEFYEEELTRAFCNEYTRSVLALWQRTHPDAPGLLRRLEDGVRASGSDTAAEAFQFHASRLLGEESIPGREGWRLLAELGSGSGYGRMGLIRAAQSPGEAEKLLAGVENFALLPPEALQHALALGAELPEGFYRQSAEQLSAQAAGVAALMKDRPDAAMMCGAAQEHPGRALFGYALATELAGNLDWEKQGSMSLMDYYCDRTEEYLNLFYKPAMLAAESLYALPTLTRFAARCVQARKARRAGDELGYVRELKAGLETCPGMKNMVSWLVERARAKAAGLKATPELMALAAQIRAILAQYPADDPAVLALKASGEYKLVAHLIEEEQ